MPQLKTLKTKLWQWRAVLLMAPAVTLGVIGLRSLGILQSLEWMAFDSYFQLRPTDKTDKHVVIISIDENDIKEVGQGVIPDGKLTEILQKIHKADPTAIGLDLYRDLPIEPGHDKLVSFIEQTPNLIGIQKVVGQQGFDTIPPPPALAQKGQVGANDLLVDADNIVRRSFLSVDDAEGNTVYSLSFYLALFYLDEQGISPTVDENENWQLNQASFPALNPNDGSYIKTNALGHQQLIHYFGPSNTFQHYSLTALLRNQLPKDWAKDKIVLIGKTGESFKDRFYVPFSRNIANSGVQMAGVEIHANLTEQIIQAAIANRPQFQFIPESWEWGIIAAASLIGACLAGLPTNKLKFARVLQWSGTLGIITVILGGNLLAFSRSYWLPVVPPLISLTGAAIGVTAWKARSASGIRRTFGRYLSDDIVSTLLENPDGLALGGDRRNITILTSDLRGFTATAERLPPEDVIKILNFYLGVMADIITEHQGTIDEFMGDGILVLFGAPIQRPDDPQRAINCAIAMQLAMEQVNQQMEDWGYMPLEMGIGIHTGEVVVGNIGSEKRSKYGIVGSPVNLTYRIESYTTGGQVLISESTHHLTQSILEVQGTQTVQAKGIPEPITIFDISGVTHPIQKQLPKIEKTYIQLKDVIECQVQLLSGKDISADLGQGTITHLSQKHGQLRLQTLEKLQSLQNLKLTITCQNHPTDCYGKIITLDAKTKTIELQFTSIPPTIAQVFTQAKESHA